MGAGARHQEIPLALGFPLLSGCFLGEVLVELLGLAKFGADA